MSAQVLACSSYVWSKNDLVTYEGAPHSFFDRTYEEHADACADAWRRILAFVET